MNRAVKDIANTLKNAADKQRFRNAAANFVAAYSIPANAIIHRSFCEIILAVNLEAKGCLLKSSSAICPQVRRNFEIQQDLITINLHEALLCFHLTTDI